MAQDERQALLEQIERATLLREIQAQGQPGAPPTTAPASAPAAGSAPPSDDPGFASDFFGGVNEMLIQPNIQLGSDLGTVLGAALTGGPFSPFSEQAGEAAGRLRGIPGQVIQGIQDRAAAGGRRIGEAISPGGPTSELGPRALEILANPPAGADIPAPPEQGPGMAERLATGARGVLDLGLAGAGAIPGLGGAGARIGSAMIGQAAGHVADTAAEGNLDRAAGQAAGLLAPLGIARASRRVPQPKAPAPEAVTLPSGRRVEIPMSRGEGSGVGSLIYRGLEPVARGSKIAEGPLKALDIKRQKILVDEVAGGIVKDISAFEGDSVAAGVRLQNRLQQSLDAMDRQIRAGLDVADADIAGIPIVPSRVRQFARQEIKRLQDKAGGPSSADQAVIKDLGRPAGMRVSAAEDFLTFFREMRENARAMPGQLDGIAGGRARKLAKLAADDIRDGVKIADPQAARNWQRANDMFRGLTKRIENQTYQSLLKAQPEKVPEILARIDQRDIPRLRKAVGKDAFEAASARLLEQTLTRAIEGERLSGGAFGQGFFQGVADAFTPSRGVKVGPLKRSIERLREGGRLNRIYGDRVANSLTELIGAVERAADSQKVGAASIIGRSIDAAVFFAPFRFIPPTTSLGSAGALRIFSSIAAKPKGASLLQKVIANLDDPARSAFWGARLGEYVMDDPKVRDMYLQAGQASAPGAQ